MEPGCSALSVTYHILFYSDCKLQSVTVMSSDNPMGLYHMVLYDMVLYDNPMPLILIWGMAPKCPVLGKGEVTTTKLPPTSAKYHISHIQYAWHVRFLKTYQICATICAHIVLIYHLPPVDGNLLI